MSIKIKDIPPEGFTREYDQPIDLFDRSKAETVCKAILNIKPLENGIVHISGHIRSTPILECSRCLVDFSFPIDADVNVDLAPTDSLLREGEHELVPGELDMEFYQGDEIDPLEIIREQLLVALPMVPIHSPECKGLCSVCGENLNTRECGHQRNAPGDFGAFSSLKDLLKK